MLALALSIGLAQSPLTNAPNPVPKVPAPLPHMLDVKSPPPPSALPDRPPLPRAEPRTGSAAAAARVKPRAGGTPPRAPRAVPTRVQFDTAVDGALWALGSAWKARFDTRGVEFVPWFGSSAPRNFPLRLDLASVRRGERELPLVASAPLEHDGERVVLDRGVVTETYATTLDAVEQSFTFDELPGSGDLALTIAVTSELCGTDGVDGLAFANEHGRVAYGAAVAIDARGARQAARTRLVDGGIEITVDADFLRRARLPLVVDPVITTFAVASTADDDLRPDAAYDPANDRWLVVWERTFSQTDKDVWSEELDASGAAIPGTLGAIDFTGSSWVQPRVAYNALSQVFLTVAQAAPFGGNREVWGRMRHAGTGALDAQFQISSAADTGEKLDPDVGGDPALVGPTYFLVAWTRTYTTSDHDVHARLVAPDGTLQGPATMLIDNTGGTNDNHPSVSKSDGLPPFADQRWNVVWDRELSFTDRDLYAAQVRWDGAIVNPSTPLFTGVTDLRYPSASSLRDAGPEPRRWCIACTDTFGTQSDVDVLLVDGVTMVGGINLSATENGGALEFEDQIYPNVDSDGSRFVVAYSEQYQTNFDYDVYASTCVAAGNEVYVTEAHQTLAFSTTVEWIAQVATRHASGGTQLGALVTWWDGGTTTSQSDVEAGLYDAAAGGPVVPWCLSGGHVHVSVCPCGVDPAIGHGCPNSVFADGGLLGVSGVASVSADTLVLQGSYMPNSTALYYQGSADAGMNVIDDGVSCVGGTIVRLGTKTNVGNASQYPEAFNQPVSVRGAIPAPGGTYFYQCYYRNAANYCTPATSNRTNGIELVWLP